jgi:hypothetical protein
VFIQVIQGKVADADGVRRQSDAWLRDIKPKVEGKGYLGFTGGITPDGRLMWLARFESEEAARANSELPEQGAWWEQTAQTLDGDATFHDCAEVDLVLGGGSNDAGFVQVIQGRAKDQQAMRARRAEFERRLGEARPDVLGGVVAWHGDGAFTQAMYFTSEEEARDREKGTEDSDTRQEFMSLIDGQPTFFDLPDPTID